MPCLWESHSCGCAMPLSVLWAGPRRGREGLSNWHRGAASLPTPLPSPSVLQWVSKATRPLTRKRLPGAESLQVRFQSQGSCARPPWQGLLRRPPQWWRSAVPPAADQCASSPCRIFAKQREEVQSHSLVGISLKVKCVVSFSWAYFLLSYLFLIKLQELYY